MNPLPKNLSVACNQSRHKNQRSDRNQSRCRFTLRHAAGGIERIWLGSRCSFFSARMPVWTTRIRSFVPSSYTPLMQNFKMSSRRRPYACRCSRILCDAPFSTCDGQLQAIVVVSHYDTPPRSLSAGLSHASLEVVALFAMTLRLRLAMAQNPEKGCVYLLVSQSQSQFIPCGLRFRDSVPSALP
jgi:hypothetical protein